MHICMYNYYYTEILYTCIIVNLMDFSASKYIYMTEFYRKYQMGKQLDIRIPGSYTNENVNYMC